jgi:hypothetical protein
MPSMLGAVPVADAAQLHAALTSDLASAACVRRVVMELFDVGLVGRVRRGWAWVWHLTEVGRRARADRDGHGDRVRPARVGRDHGLGDGVAHPVEGRRINTDAVLTLAHRSFLVEVDRKSMPEWRQLRKVDAYGACATHRVHVGPRRLQGSTRPVWQAAYPGTRCPSLLVVFAGGSRTALDRRRERLMKAALKGPADPSRRASLISRRRAAGRRSEHDLPGVVQPIAREQITYCVEGCFGAATGQESHAVVVTQEHVMAEEPAGAVLLLAHRTGREGQSSAVVFQHLDAVVVEVAQEVAELAIGLEGFRQHDYWNRSPRRSVPRSKKSPVQPDTC